MKNKYAKALLVQQGIQDALLGDKGLTSLYEKEKTEVMQKTNHSRGYAKG